MKIDFVIKSRGSMLIKYGERVVLISGELTFEPSIFYADLNSFKNWEPPFEGEEINQEQKNEIVDYISNSESSTKIIFG
jgi:hypothetical protein